MTGRQDAGPRGTALLVIAKTPVPGRVKTRLVPPLDAAEACEVAWACLLETLDVATRVAADRHVLVLDGDPGPWVPPCFDVIAQRGVGLGDRLAAAFSDTFASFASRALVIAMDTPQVDAATLGAALSLLDGGAPSVLGPATDGGFWAIGLHESCRPDGVFADVPMSTPHTGACQHARLEELGLAPVLLPELRDLDDVADLIAIGHGGPPRLRTILDRLRPVLLNPEVSPCPSSN